MYSRTVKLNAEQTTSAYAFFLVKKKSEPRWYSRNSENMRCREAYEYLCERYGQAVQSALGFEAVRLQLEQCDSYAQCNDEMPGIAPDIIPAPVRDQSNDFRTGVLLGTAIGLTAARMMRRR